MLEPKNLRRKEIVGNDSISQVGCNWAVVVEED